jgi:hypothetical protein
MKKIILMALLFAIVQIGMAQTPCGGPQFRITTSATYNTTSFCAPGTVTVTGSATLSTCEIDPPAYGFCPSATLIVRLQFYNGITWSTAASQTINNGNSYSLSQSPTATRQYRINVTVNATGSYCSGAGSTSFTGHQQTVTVNNATTSSFRINGQTVNTVNNVEVCDAANIIMDNITWTGTNSSYGYRVGTRKGAGGLIWQSWINGTPPSSIDIKSTLQTLYGLPLAGDYEIHLQTRNLCNLITPHTFWGKLRVLTGGINISLEARNGGNPPNWTAVSTSTSCTSPHTQLCVGSSVLRAINSSVPTFVGGQWSCKLERVPLNNCTATPTLVFDKPTASLTNLSDLDNIDLNSFSGLYGSLGFGYVSNNSATSVWRFTITVSNTCTSSTRVYWLRNATSTCKDEAITSIDDAQIKEGWIAFPNPVSNLLNILWEGNDDNMPSLKLFDLQGKEVMVPIVLANKGNIQLGLNNLNKGVYMLEFNNGKKEYQKVIVE